MYIAFIDILVHIVSSGLKFQNHIDLYLHTPTNWFCNPVDVCTVGTAPIDKMRRQEIFECAMLTYIC